ncbi:putative ABC-type transport system involved in lysophospholipase L1 biosynthesis, permease component [Saccharomonospora marina XMU15]|uniref:Putative ABC-type transport system involved in lysophospholipase L1 biosynthesis, permease component n=1 Tax=Saccharomonospora marina XMU15 TaxID=882083 RepID=H5WXU6_9PSEU|nr:FtsX-like permease family protein [Saccharomonospora marina]EHR51755.1 putative ABC-type transport system involved in lysophospholipase L1 biosynthesis, permease component [Saccharomonospora marina XMU15]
MIRDLLLGLRLAVGGGRMSGQALLRLAMTTFGVALVVAILLPAASANSLADARDAREAARAQLTEPRPGVDPLYERGWYVDAGEEELSTTVVAPGGPRAPVPPGLDRLPRPGELMASPAAAEFLNSEEGAAVKAHLGGRIVGEVGKAGLNLANDKVVFVGAKASELADDPNMYRVYGFGVPPTSGELDMAVAVLIAPLAVVVLLPLLVFVTTASRMGAAERERRLAALRLVGLSSKQVRRVAAGEALVGAVAGLALGAGLFIALRPLVGDVELFGMQFFADDFVPPWQLVALIALLVPGLAVGAAIFGLRHTVVEPLGVVRRGKQRQRRTWWRWTITGVGALTMALTFLFAPHDNSEFVSTALAVGSGLVLIGVSALLPWAVERLVSRLRGGPASWQLAVRRLQLESGTASRVVSGLVVVLAGSILIQTVVGSVGTNEGEYWEPRQPPAAQFMLEQSGRSEVVKVSGLMRDDPAISDVRFVSRTSVAPEGAPDSAIGATIGDCKSLATLAQLGSCTDGDVFVVGARTESGPASPQPGPARFVQYPDGADGPVYGDRWSIPDTAKHIPAERATLVSSGTVLATPGALGRARVPVADRDRFLLVWGSGDDNAALTAATEITVGAVSQPRWTVYISPDPSRLTWLSDADSALRTMRSILLMVSLFVLAVAALSLLLLSIEQIAERRRPLAALSASGVPLSVLARGSLWQNAIPVAVGVVLAVAAGLGITWPTLRYAGLEFSLDSAMIGTICGAAVVAVLAATALSLPMLRQVTKLDGLRSE